VDEPVLYVGRLLDVYASSAAPNCRVWVVVAALAVPDSAAAPPNAMADARIGSITRAAARRTPWNRVVVRLVKVRSPSPIGVRRGADHYEIPYGGVWDRFAERCRWGACHPDGRRRVGGGRELADSAAWRPGDA
jgi:hypothetical protein